MNPITSFQTYFDLRESFIFWGKYLSASLFIASLILLFNFWLKPFRRLLFWLSILSLSACFASLVWYHFKINQILVLPIANKSTTRFYLPFWIEGEKLFFWAFLFSILLISRPNKKIESWLYFGLGVLVLSSLLFDQAFLNPLPSFNREVLETWQMAKNAETSQAYEYLLQFGFRAKYFYNTTYMWTHPPFIFFSYAAFFYSFIASLYLLHHLDEEVEKLIYSFIKIGYFALTVGLLVGYPWAVSAWKNEPWWWSPKLNISLMMWLLYTAYLHLRLHPNYRKNFRWLTCLNLLSFSSLFLTYLSTYLIPGVHAYG